VVVEPSGLLELNNFTSQRLDDEETAVEQAVDSSAAAGPAPSPSQRSAERAEGLGTLECTLTYLGI